MVGVSERETRYMADADYRKSRGLRPRDGAVTVRWQTIPGRETDDGGQRAVDEILAVGVHAEMMDEANCWMDVLGLRVWIRAMRVKGQYEPRLVITAEPESCHAVETDKGRQHAARGQGCAGAGR